MRDVISAEQLFNLWQSECECLQIIDLRPLRDFEAGHIPGAMHCLPEDLAESLTNMSKETLIVLVLPQTPLELANLERHDNLVWLTEGMSQWRALGLPLSPMPLWQIENLSRRGKSS